MQTLVILVVCCFMLANCRRLSLGEFEAESPRSRSTSLNGFHADTWQQETDRYGDYYK